MRSGAAGRSSASASSSSAARSCPGRPASGRARAPASPWHCERPALGALSCRHAAGRGGGRPLPVVRRASPRDQPRRRESGHEHRRRDACGAAVVLLHEARQHRRVIRFARGFEQETSRPTIFRHEPRRAGPRPGCPGGPAPAHPPRSPRGAIFCDSIVRSMAFTLSRSAAARRTRSPPRPPASACSARGDGLLAAFEE